ncbi:KH domain-containing, RNA-binding, signal transduction-associated protein 2-like isoform X2 [Centruroides vittatus]|uniref:KH domain-containing, RNA-binding, signal transduction-associated protein 2-like isoform X2 n=1 Tax=Centruroides vittatus TaxID=120091 RepID=UPI003510B3B9
MEEESSPTTATDLQMSTALDNSNNSEIATYLSELISERDKIPSEYQLATRLIEQEIQRHQSGSKDSLVKPPLLDIHKGKPLKLLVRVLVPVKDHPNFNFVGKLLGPKGNSLKRLQEETQTRMAILGRGSMRDKAKEEELRGNGDPKYSHLNEELHVEITAFAPASEAYSRMAHALSEVKRFLVPDYYDDIRQDQLRELALLNGERSGPKAETFGSPPPLPPPTGSTSLTVRLRPSTTRGRRYPVPTSPAGRSLVQGPGKVTTMWRAPPPRSIPPPAGRIVMKQRVPEGTTYPEDNGHMYEDAYNDHAYTEVYEELSNENYLDAYPDEYEGNGYTEPEYIR